MVVTQQAHFITAHAVQTQKHKSNSLSNEAPLYLNLILLLYLHFVCSYVTFTIFKVKYSCTYCTLFLMPLLVYLISIKYIVCYIMFFWEISIILLSFLQMRNIRMKLILIFAALCLGALSQSKWFVCCLLIVSLFCSSDVVKITGYYKKWLLLLMSQLHLSVHSMTKQQRTREKRAKNKKRNQSNRKLNSAKHDTLPKWQTCDTYLMYKEGQLPVF